MSIQFNPNHPTPSSSQKGPSEPTFQRFLSAWINAIQEGWLKERNPEEFCKRAWKKQTNTPASEATQEFMQACLKECSVYRRQCDWARLN